MKAHRLESVRPDIQAGARLVAIIRRDAVEGLQGNIPRLLGCCDEEASGDTRPYNANPHVDTALEGDATNERMRTQQ